MEHVEMLQDIRDDWVLVPRGLLEAAVCPMKESGCDGTQYPVQPHGEGEQCQWCYERNAALSAPQPPAEARECPHRTRCDCIGACKYGMAGDGAAPAEVQARPAKPSECTDGCPALTVCDHCQWPPGPDALGGVGRLVAKWRERVRGMEGSWDDKSADGYRDATEDCANELEALAQQPAPVASQLYAHKFAEAQQSAAVDAVHELRLCESSRLHLFPDRLYRFTADPDCSMCAEALSHCALADLQGDES